MSLNRKHNAICPIHIKSCVLHAKSHVSLPSYYGSTCQRMTPVVPDGLTLAAQEHYLQSYALPIQPRKRPEPNGVNSVQSTAMMLMMMMISSTINHLSIITTQLMKVMTPFLIFPTTIMTSMTTCHQISFAKKRNKLIPHLKRQGDSTSEREDGSDEETNSASERDIGFDEETDSTSESADGSGIGTSGSIGSVNTNPGPAIPPNDETAFSSTPQFSKDQANLVKLEVVSLVLEIGAPLHSFHKIAQGAGRANSCGHIFKPNDCPHYKTYLKDLIRRLKLESLSHTMEDVLVPWDGRVKLPVFDFWAMFQSLIDDPRLCKELLINWNNPSSIPPYNKDYLDEIHSAEWYHDTYKLYNI